MKKLVFLLLIIGTYFWMKYSINETNHTFTQRDVAPVATSGNNSYSAQTSVPYLADRTPLPTAPPKNEWSSKPIAACVSEKAFDAITHFSNTGSDYGVSQLLNSGQCRVFPANTRIAPLHQGLMVSSFMFDGVEWFTITEAVRARR